MEERKNLFTLRTNKRIKNQASKQSKNTKSGLKKKQNSIEISVSAIQRKLLLIFEVIYFAL